MDETPAPHGRELEAAVRLHAFCAARWPHISWEIQPVGRSGANLIGRCGASPSRVVLYSHLDTSLDGGAQDAAVTGRCDPVGPLRTNGLRVSGFGVGVARGPAAAALVAFVAAADRAEATLLLAGSGTHRLRPGETSGVVTYLEANAHPEHAIIAKAGPPGVLYSEPGAAYLTVLIHNRQGAVLARSRHTPEGGVLAHAGTVIAVIEKWRAERLNAAQPEARYQIGREVGIGYAGAGLRSKPDLLPAEFELGLYLVTLPGDSVAEAADSLERSLIRTVPEGCTARVQGHEVHPAGVTEESAGIVQRAVRVRQAHLGAARPITGWTGSTDGVVFRGHGIDTVRLGPTIGPSTEDPRRDEVGLGTLATWAKIYQELLHNRGTPDR